MNEMIKKGVECVAAGVCFGLGLTVYNKKILPKLNKKKTTNKDTTKVKKNKGKK